MFNIKNFYSEQIIIHRGIFNNEDIPENSMMAFRLCISKSLPFEFDVHLTKDNKLVIFHDENLFRMTGINKNIENTTYEEIKNYFLLNTMYKIPLLEDVLNLVNGKVFIDIELKSNKRNIKLCDEVIKILDKYNGNFIIKSFDTNIMKYLKEKRKNYIRGILIPYKIEKNKLLSFINISKIIKEVEPNFLAINKKLVKLKYFKNKRKKGITLITWTLKEDEIDKYIDYSDSFLINKTIKKRINPKIDSIY